MTTVTNLTPWGYHAILDCSNCDLAAIQSESTVRSWLADLTSVLSATAASDALITVTGKNNAKTEGLAVAQLLDIGTVTANFVNSEQHIYIDLFCSKEYTVSSIEETVKKYFGTDSIVNKILIPRNAGVVPPQ